MTRWLRSWWPLCSLYAWLWLVAALHPQGWWGLLWAILVVPPLVVLIDHERERDELAAERDREKAWWSGQR